jgi:hypothetical protein
MKNNISIIIHGKITPKTKSTIDYLVKNYKDSEIILCVSQNEKNLKNLNLKEVKLLKYREKPKFPDYGVLTQNFLNYSFSAFHGVIHSSNKDVLTISSDFVFDKNNLNLKNEKKSKVVYSKYKGAAYPIYVFPFNNSYCNSLHDYSLVFGKKEQLKVLFNCKENDYPNLFNTSIFPKKIKDTNNAYFTNNDILYISYLKKILSNKRNEISFDEIIGHYREHYFNFDNLIKPLYDSKDL